MTVPNYQTERALSVTLAAAVAVGQLVGINGSGLGVLADANDVPIPARGFAVSGGAIGARITICRSGRVEGFTSLTPGATVYTSPTAGGVTHTRPVTAGDSVQAVGYAVSATCVDFEITDPAFIIQAAGTSTIA